MIVLFLGLLTFVLALATFVNVRGPMIETVQDRYTKDNFRFFNPCSSTNSKGLLATAWRYSNRCYCPDRWLPLINDYSKQNSYVYLSIGGHVKDAVAIDTSVFGPADGYEDPRITWIDDSTLFILFVKFIKNVESSDMCAGLIDVGPSGFTMTRTRMFTSTQRQKNWIAKVNNSMSIDLYARIESPQIVYHLSTTELVGHSVIEIQSCTLPSSWRGSSFFCATKGRHVALVHRRLTPTLMNRFMPSYDYAFCYLDRGIVTFSEPFQLKDPKGFVYASGLQVNAQTGSYEISAGITDCYSETIQANENEKR